MRGFVGRTYELDLLNRELTQVSHHVGSKQPGRCLLIRGRRRVGKSVLVENFIQQADIPSVYYTATGISAEEDLGQFHEDIVASSLPKRDIYDAATPDNWLKSLRLLAEILPDDQPSIVVLDEVPYLIQEGIGFEGALQRCWDRNLSRKPVLLLLIGSDLSMMEALNSYGRPFHQRGREMVLNPLNPAEVSYMLGLDAAMTFDAYLITGGLPLLCNEWPRGASPEQYLAEALAAPTSALRVTGSLVLASEFPQSAQAHRVLTAIGSGERTFSNIANAAGHLGPGSLSRSLELLQEKRIIVGELPLSTKPSKERRYQISDSYLRFWLYFVEPNLPELERMRSDLTMERIQKSWSSWRGRAIEPVVREALARLLPDDKLPTAQAVGAYWTRSNDVEIDIVGADRAPVAKKLLFVGSIKWLENSPFDDRDLAALLTHRARFTDQPLPVAAISRSGISCRGLNASYSPTDLLSAWHIASV